LDAEAAEPAPHQEQQPDEREIATEGEVAELPAGALDQEERARDEEEHAEQF